MNYLVIFSSLEKALTDWNFTGNPEGSATNITPSPPKFSSAGVYTIFKDPIVGFGTILFLPFFCKSKTPMQFGDGAMYFAFLGLSGSNGVVPFDGRENGYSFK
jgi:hypothetical protein